MEKFALHKPVLVNEVIEFLQLQKGAKVLDATLGLGGHAEEILKKIQPDGLLVGIDRDKNALKIAEERLAPFKNSTKIVYSNFRDLDKVLSQFAIGKIDAALFDVGLSSLQIEDEGRGFSFEREGPLDMRMDLSSPLSAYDIVNRLKKEEIENIIRDFGEERHYRKITRFIVEARKKRAINSTAQLTGIIKEAVGAKYRSQKIHPATRTFQALRIAVNGELENISEGLEKVLGFLNVGRRVCAISFHSLEDRIVKKRFKEFEKSGQGRVITKKPVTPSYREIAKNPRSRSAKLRVFEKE